jgi:hypothetical protein
VTPEQAKPVIHGDFSPPFGFSGLHVDPEAVPRTIAYNEFHQTGDPFDTPEGKSRRLLELRLLQNYIVNTSQTLASCHNDEVRHAWSVEVPQLALQYDNLLYEIFAISALHLLTADPHNPELIAARQNYLGLSLREHRRAITTLSSESAEAICFASSLILIDAFASLQDRILEPYMPPMEWLMMARGAGSVFDVALNAINNFQNAKILVVVQAHPYVHDRNVIFSEHNRQELLGLLGPEIPGEIWDAETQEAYEMTLSYIGGVQIAIDSGEHVMGICRRMMAFATLIPKKFVDFVQEMRPRALAVLAHFFALAASMVDIWWIGSTVQREILGIQQVLPLEWQGMIQMPVTLAGLTPL